MSKQNGHSGSASVNAGSASKPTRDEAAQEFEIAGNAELKGEKPSPGNRDRGETSSADSASPVDTDANR